MMSKLSIEDLSIFAKKKGFVFPSTEIYGGMSGFFEYGPLGVELKNSLKQHWWKTFVQDRDDICGIDGSIISSGKVWEASGHLSSFADLLTECSKCKKNHRADHLIEDKLKINVEGLGADALNKIIRDNKLECPECKGSLKEIASFNLMFPVQVGADATKDSTAYLRGETAQLIFTAFKSVVDSSRVKLPFGIAQIGKAFRNEISPRDFLFRTREFEQMEIEYFIRPKEKKCPLLSKRQLDLEVLFYSESAQKSKKEQKKVKISQLVKNKVMGEWHAYWLAESYLWYTELGMQEKNLRIREHTSEELSHYSSGTFDIDYNFPFGWKEIHGNANRGQFDLTQHQKFSGKPMDIFDEETKEKMIPWVVEPSFGADRAFLAFLYDAYHEDKERGNIVLKLHPKLAPFKVAVFPLVNKIEEQALQVYLLLKKDFISMFDRSGSVGRRYARADEIGIPYCVTVDFDTEKDKSVTIRDRDTTKQIRVKITELKDVLRKLLDGEKFESCGKVLSQK
ncbi:glycine--tRNA ligase [Candidatus Woesearchaeota archaeon]|nr:glycine--tRNA ligase [Candidatus Woesearchaeota archaeon]